jgi:hypothetical protein
MSRYTHPPCLFARVKRRNLRAEPFLFKAAVVFAFVCSHRVGNRATFSDSRSNFMALLQEQSGGIPSSSCTICTLLQEEEDLRIRELISYTEHKLVAQWLRSQAVLCMINVAKLKYGAPPVVVSTVNAIMERRRRQLVEDLARLHGEYLPDAERWGSGTRGGIYGFAAWVTRIKGGDMLSAGKAVKVSIYLSEDPRTTEQQHILAFWIFYSSSAESRARRC